MIFSRDVKFDEDTLWNWEDSNIEQRSSFTPQLHIPENDISSSILSGSNQNNAPQALESSSPRDMSSFSSESPVGKTKLLSEIYERCNMAFIEPTNYDEASKCNE